MKTLDNCGRIHYSFLLMIFIVITLLSFMLLDGKIISHVKDKADNSLVTAAFSASSCDGRKMSDRMKIIKEDDNGIVTYNFEKMFSDAGILLKTEAAKENAERIFLKNAAPKGINGNTASGHQIKSVIIYNVSENLEIYKWENGKEFFDKIYDYGKDNYILSPNGVCIDKTSLYVSAELTIQGLFNHQRRVKVEKCIALRFANE